MKYLILMIGIFNFNLIYGLDTANNGETTLVIASTATASNRFKRDIEFEFDETDISRLSLKIKWNVTSDQIKSPDRFVLLMEQKRLNLSSFLFDYSSPQLIDDETTIESSTMSPNQFRYRLPLTQQTNIDCAMNCINSTKFSSTNQTFECNIYYYEPHSKVCVLYEYDTESAAEKYSSVEPEWTLQNDNIYDYFIDECEIDEILGDVIGFSRYCRRLLDYKESHVVKINPYIDYRFSLSIRTGNKWTPFVLREYQYAPKITIEVRGELKLGKNITIECKTDLHSSIIDSITWKNSNPQMKGILRLSPLTVYNMYQTYFCEIRYNFVRMMQKAFKLNLTDLGDTKPKLQLSYLTDNENLNVKINWSITMPPGNRFRPERLILLYSENNNKIYKFVNKYLLFQLTNFDNTKFSGQLGREELLTSSEDECATACLQKNFCEHFVFYKSLEPINTNNRSVKRKNCILSSNSNDNIISCRLDSICANLLPFENQIQNNTFSISILPNVTYKFKIQMKDKFLNWTSEEETESINIPLNIRIEQSGLTLLKNENTNNFFELTCRTNLNKQLNLDINWIKDGKEITADDQLYAIKAASNSNNLSSVLEFKSLNFSKKDNYSGVYKCRVYDRIADVSQSTYYISGPRNLEFSFYSQLKYDVLTSNITLPTIPGLLLELSCNVIGNPEPNLKWMIDGVNYSTKKFEFLTDEPFVINITYRNTSQLNHILVMKTDNARNLSKYECILNDNTTIRQHFIKVIDEKPQLDIQVDKSALNKLKLKFKIKVKNQNQDLLKNINTKTLKLSIVYVENSTFSSAFQTIIAPDTLSKSDSKSKTALSDRLPIATLKHTIHGILSCKMLCFNTAFCKSYEYLIYDDSCNLYSTAEVESQYETLIDQLKKKSNSSFNLIHLLRGNILSLVQEDSSLNNKIMIDKKIYPECEPKPAKFLYTEEIHCNDELNDFNETYVMENLSPATNYQFKIEVANAFGKSSAFITDQIEAPFILNPVVEKSENNSTTSLLCSTPIIETKNLQFIWYRYEMLIAKNNTDYEQILYQPADDSKNALFSSELKIKASPKYLDGFYTCSLVFNEDFYSLVKNESIIFRPRYGPVITVNNNRTTVNKFNGDIFTESCSAEGWPLPVIEWQFNDKPITNLSSASQPKNPYIVINHHRHLTASSHIVISNLTQSLSGVYSCVINGKTSAKHVTLLVKSNSHNNLPIDNKTDDKNESNKQPNKASSNVSRILVSIIFASIICSVVAYAAFSYYKKNRSNSNTSLSYNRIEEEMMAGVDNLTLLEDNQLEPITT